MLKLPRTYPGCAYDTDLPIEWVADMTRRGFDPRYQFVWAYPKGSVLGIPYPLTPRAAHKFLSRVRNAPFYLDQWQLCQEPK
jgi:hypothetical protein